ncbi:invasion associated locus B family protein [Bradyrhizobium jicamae]|uniref:invasion associated locus B family protein n=1 Tax=Bradyrhizobium jicamae TaxID=280332 RepID=UPI001BA544D8|nr:invasion associated locus B family protein [Bradyrhizobium jicamae]MBR0757371.1 invasion associated locus B family protein [Bradyrhizobium jicamae]
MRYVIPGSMAALLALAGVSHAADPRAAELTYQPWIKHCITETNCFVGIEAKGQCAPSGGFITLALQSNKRAVLSANVGTRTMLDGPISIQIDQDAPIKITNQHCHANGCGGTFALDSDMFDRLASAQNITMQATSLTGQKFSFSFSMTGFANAYHGPGIEPKVVEETQQKLQERAEKQPPPPACED